MQPILLTGLSLLNSLLNLAIQVLIARRFGVGAVTDAYFAALATPLFLAGLYASQVTFRVVPSLMAARDGADGSGRSQELSILRDAVRIGVLVGAAGTAWSLGQGLLGVGQWGRSAVPLLLPAGWLFGASQFPLLAVLAILQARHRYLESAFAALAPSLVTASVLLACGSCPIVVAVLLPTAAGIAVVVGVRFALSREERGGAEAHPNAAPQTGGARALATELPFTVATLTGFSVYAPIDATILPRFGAGYLTIAAICQRIVIGLGQIAVTAPMTLTTRRLVAAIGARDVAAYRMAVTRATQGVALIALALVAALAVFAKPIMLVLVSARSASSPDLSVGVSTLREMLPGTILMLVSNMVVRSALAVPGMVRRTWWLGAAWGVMYVAALLAVSRPGRNGSGIAYSVAWCVSAPALWLYVRRWSPRLIRGVQG